MGKGRRHGAATERLLTAPAHFGSGDGSGGGGGEGDLADLADLAEEDVWRCFHSAAEGSRDPRRGCRWVKSHAGGLSLGFDDARRPGPAAASQQHWAAVAGSAPVDVPSWPRSLVCEEAEAAERELVPPHEYLARAQGKSVATSVLEGAGRTLKGRDVSRVRDAVWRQTGFSG